MDCQGGTRVPLHRAITLTDDHSCGNGTHPHDPLPRVPLVTTTTRAAAKGTPVLVPAARTLSNVLGSNGTRTTYSCSATRTPTTTSGDDG